MSESSTYLVFTFETIDGSFRDGGAPNFPLARRGQFQRTYKLDSVAPLYLYLAARPKTFAEAWVGDGPRRGTVV